jgi:hypothetical protein
VVLTVSVDTDEQKWKDFAEKNEMTWLQYRDQSVLQDETHRRRVHRGQVEETRGARSGLEDRNGAVGFLRCLMGSSTSGFPEMLK